MLHVKSPELTTRAVTRSSKINNVVEYIKQKCFLKFTFRKNVAVDESTVGFKERIAFKTYNPQTLNEFNEMDQRLVNLSKEMLKVAVIL